MEHFNGLMELKDGAWIGRQWLQLWLNDGSMHGLLQGRLRVLIGEEGRVGG